METDDIFRGFGVEITLPDPQNFLKVKETLTRIGISSKKEKKLWQSCHILHRRGRYVIIHFKELFGLDGNEITFSEEDLCRRNTIVNLLEDWGLVDIIDQNKTEEPVAPMSAIKVLSFKEKPEWVLEAKYAVGRKFSTEKKDQPPTEIGG